ILRLYLLQLFTLFPYTTLFRSKNFAFSKQQSSPSYIIFCTKQTVELLHVIYSTAFLRCRGFPCLDPLLLIQDELQNQFLLITQTFVYLILLHTKDIEAL